MSEPIEPANFRGRRLLILGLTQAELAERMGVSQHRISEWERGVRPVPKWAGASLALVEELSAKK